MRAQLSLELLIYVAIASSAALASMFALSRLLSSTSSVVSTYALEQFVASLNAALAYGNSTASIYIPPGACNTSIQGQVLHFGNATYQLLEPIRGNFLCPDGSWALLNFTYFGTYASIRRYQ